MNINRIISFAMITIIFFSLFSYKGTVIKEAFMNPDMAAMGPDPDMPPIPQDMPPMPPDMPPMPPDMPGMGPHPDMVEMPPKDMGDDMSMDERLTMLEDEIAYLKNNCCS